MTQLHDVLAIVAVNRFANRAPERDLVVAIHHRVVWNDAAAQVHRHIGGNDRSHAAAGKRFFPVDAGLCPGTVVIVETS